MFNIQGGNKFGGSGVNVNTAVCSYYSDSCQLKVSLWNDKFSIKFAPLKGINADGLRMYAQDRADIISTSLSSDNIIALNEGIDNVIMPALENGAEAEISVTISSGENRKVLTIKTTANKDVLMILYLGVSDNGVATGDKIQHLFNKREYMTSYNPETGENTAIEVNTDFINFKDKLESFRKTTAATSHAIKYDNAIGATFKNNALTFAANNSSASYQAPQPQPTSYSSMDEFIPFN